MSGGTWVGLVSSVGFCWPGPPRHSGTPRHPQAPPGTLCCCWTLTALRFPVAEPSLLAEPWLHASAGRQAFCIGFRPGPSGLGSGTQTQTNQRAAVDAPFNWPRRHSCGISIGTIEIKTKVANCASLRESGGGETGNTGTQAHGQGHRRDRHPARLWQPGNDRLKNADRRPLQPRGRSRGSRPDSNLSFLSFVMRVALRSLQIRPHAPVPPYCVHTHTHARYSRSFLSPFSRLFA